MKGFLRFITFLVFVAIILLAFLFAVNNTTEISLWIGLDLPPLSVGVLIICAFIFGGLLGMILGIGIFRQLKYILKIRHLESRLEKLKDEESSTSGRKGR